MKTIDNQELTLVVLLDLSAAFDTVNHDILLDILKWDIGVDGSALERCRDYLQLRTQSVLIYGEVSANFSLTSGVPQGGCLGPLCFTIYASSLFKVIENHLPTRGFRYADDTQLLYTFSACMHSNACMYK